MNDAPRAGVATARRTGRGDSPARSSSLYRRRALGLATILTALMAAVILSLAHGANPLGYDQVWSALWGRDGSQASIIVWTERWPRTLLGIAVGAALGVAGALIQALTRNPLAEPGILGVNAGAGFAVTLGAGVFGLAGISQYVWFAFLGAAVTTVVVFVIGSAGSGTASPVTLVLAGVALGAVLNGFSTFLTLIDPDTFRSFRNWGLGSLARTTMEDTLLVAPFLLVGLIGALALAGPLNSIALGDDLAASLGTRVGRTRVLGIGVVTLLAGGATALTGGIAFLGLMVPHVVRWCVGPDQRWIIAYSALAAPVLVLVADVLGRVLVRPSEIEVGVVAAVIGAPVLIALVRRREASSL
ncbi:ABC-type Fe3+-siderophore transport system, permease component [Pseudonocardia sp. Ae168_Ps1]|uniref:FecCD family ABC transporter permease n=1 Tax=unclassified Pseudonocardia TaxID=2619320 RepID=UPI00096454C5|nr:MULTISPECIES: iron chelate uptake ABC transporter family permease subunit [unclassified Pseudonocardia]OLL76858.1 ABC-type Fe3+-siderophore transport system, permease component [Pseudonocardia sp. Ae150A_Ps1]OLL82872.1 ABC-type Fe3+-siderophore transport system, permease component [Pseudonocardia sp. Ae168_Ps1]OLL83016.1 ABC-type Fe3+-siderophore transport system, permease component [Pseudonocardia sp. Ae263_Ps1]OLL90945.1 ABC-type Fe3+-siderophore transport system, permease component [Pseud